mgnify:CR=1 FL=1
MPKIGDKEEKVSFICDEAYKVFIDVGIDDFSLNQFIASINMSKGQFYHYFSTKEKLIHKVVSKKIFELMNSAVEEYKNKETFIDKLNVFFNIYLNEQQCYIDLRKLYIDILHIYISSHDTEIREFNNITHNSIFTLLEEIFDDEIKKGNFDINSKKMVKPICATADGMFMHSLMIKNYDLKTELTNYFLEIEVLLSSNK